MQFIVMRLKGGSCYVAHLTGAAGQDVAIYDVYSDPGQPLPLHEAIAKVRSLNETFAASVSGTDKPLTA